MTKSGEKQEERFEYSTREMKPANLLLSDLLRAHNTFLMHHDSSLSALFVRTRRSKFVTVLSRYWDLFLSTWNVMLHGNPAREVYGGINIAASGELGVGVGEEERGSGEREVLEGLVGRIEGLVDLVVSKFGEQDPESESRAAAKDEQSPWLGTGQEPGPEDGAIFLGTGALSRKSLRDVTHWMEDLYTWGEHAYGIIESPTSVRRARARKPKQTDPTIQEETHARDAEQPTAKAGQDPSATDNQESKGAPAEMQQQQQQQQQSDADDEGKLDKMVSYLKMGYGTYWSLPGGTGSASDTPSESQTSSTQKSSDKHLKAPESTRPVMGRRKSSFDAAGHYLIGLKGEIEEGTSEHENMVSDDEEANHNSRTVVRTVHVELETGSEDQPEATIIRDFQHPASVLTQSQVVGNMVPGYNSHDLNKAHKLRVVVYVNRPFIFTFLFQLRTDSLAWDSLYRSLHYQLAPLKKPLLASARYRPERPSAGMSRSSIHDLVWDPKSLTVHSNIPNIPETYEPEESWSRADALSTHLHLLNIHRATRAKAAELERTQKTSRGWWIVWTRVLEHGREEEDASASLSTIRESTSDRQSRTSADEMTDKEGMQATVGKEIFLIRRASDHVGFRSESSTSGEGAGRLAQGIGVDTRRYIEELLSLL
jgi:hypothetical protein